MKRPRIPISTLMGVVLIVAANAAAFRLLTQTNYLVPASPTTRLYLIAFALGVLPLASLLVFVAMIRIPELWRSGQRLSFFVGFEVFGWAAIALFIVCSAISPSSVENYANACMSSIAFLIEPLLTNPPPWTEAVFEFAVVIVGFGLPQFLAALFGGWLMKKYGISLSIDAPQRGAFAQAEEEYAAVARMV